MPPRRIAIRDHSAEANLFARRAVIALVLVAVLMLVLLKNLYYLQVTRYQDYQTRSNGNRIKVLPVAPNRGLIYDRNGVLLAENRPVFRLEVVPEQVNDLEATIDALAKLLSLRDERIEDFRKELASQRRFKPVALVGNMTEQQMALFAVNQHKFPGVSIEARLKRYYPYADALTHVLGYVARITKKDLNKLIMEGLEDNYAGTHDMGKLGVEKYHESLLHGQVGYQEVEVNSSGKILRTLKVEPPVPGQDLILNLDVRLQQTAHQALQGYRGSVVVLDARDGGVLALYSNPSYDPNLFVHGISTKNFNAILANQDRPLINRATQGQYPPASTIKPHLALLGLEEGVITPTSKMLDRGSYSLPNVSHTWRDHVPQGHGYVDVTKAIVVSCDTYFYDMAYRLGIDRISSYMEQFGFGDYTGIDLYEESDGIMPSRGWKRAARNEPWYIGDTIIVGIGQSYWTATPLQLATSVMELVNRGVHYHPRILRGELTPYGIDVLPPNESPPLIIKDQNNLDVVLNAMYEVVNDPLVGTARTAFKNTSYTSAGKTGTAQLFQIGEDEEYDEEKVAAHLRDNAMYVGYAPYDNPEIVIAVAMENAGGGGSQAAPIARKMMDAYFATKSVAQE